MKKRNANLYVICLLIAFTIVVYRWNNKVIPEKAMEVEEPQRELFKIRTILLDLPDGEKEYYKYLPNLRTGRKNDALIAHGECVALKKKKKEKSNQTRMILLTDFIPYVEKVHRDKSLIANKRSPTDEEIDARLFELVETLQGNVNHDSIKLVYIFVNSLGTVDYLSSLDLKNSKNIVIQHLVKENTIKTFIEFASRCLMDEFVILGRQDILVGKGWDLVDPKVLSENRLMYALTRQPSHNSNCRNSAKITAYCKYFEYLGSHDVFVYHVKKIFTQML